jgi:drug/metabolite transporter (DMT)-like permease
MIPLVLSVASSSLIFVLFKLFERYKIDMFQAIVANYFTAFLIGFGLYHNEWNSDALNNNSWMIFAVVTAVLFISLFFVMGISSQKNGVASTSVAVKMSMAISLVMMIVGYSESVSFLKIGGIALAFLGVYLVSSGKEQRKSHAAWMLLVLFIGSGALDFTLNVVQKHFLGDLTSSLYSAISLGLAGAFGSVILLTNLIRKKTRFSGRSLLAGTILGIPNYFSIYLLLLSYKTTGWNDSTVLAVTNVSVVLCSALIGFIIFKEQSTTKKLIGLLAAILAIATLYFAN